MSLTKEIAIDQITVTENGIILIRETTKIMENGVEISKQYHRNSLYPGQDILNQPENVKAICNAVWTSEVISSYQQFLEEQKASSNVAA